MFPFRRTSTAAGRRLRKRNKIIVDELDDWNVFFQHLTCKTHTKRFFQISFPLPTPSKATLTNSWLVVLPLVIDLPISCQCPRLLLLPLVGRSPRFHLESPLPIIRAVHELQRRYLTWSAHSVLSLHCAFWTFPLYIHLYCYQMKEKRYYILISYYLIVLATSSNIRLPLLLLLPSSRLAPKLISISKARVVKTHIENNIIHLNSSWKPCSMNIFIKINTTLNLLEHTSMKNGRYIISSKDINSR